MKAACVILSLIAALVLIPRVGFAGRFNIRAELAAPEKNMPEPVPDHPAKAAVFLPHMSYVPYTPPTIPDALVALGEQDPEQGPEYALVVEKKSQTLHVFKAGQKVEEVLTLPCSTGENEGPKQVSGDGKTPEGVYFFTRHHPKSELTPIYGTHAFPLDYPNAWDANREKGGYAIWLHGTDKPLKPRESNGCVALNNDDLETLVPFIRLNHTPMVIDYEIRLAGPKELAEKKKKITAFVESWTQALNKGTYHEFLAFFSPDFFPDMSWWRVWQKKRGQFQKPGSPFGAAVDMLRIFYHQGVYLAVFRQVLRYAGGPSVAVGTKKLFIKDGESHLKIVAESFQGRASSGREDEKKQSPHPLILALDQLPRDPAEKEMVARFIDNWLKAWSSGDMDRYGRFYSDKFKSNGKTKNEWIAHKKRISENSTDVRVSREQDPDIKKDGPHIRVSFMQDYTSSQYSAKGKKSLVLEKNGDKYRIIREAWEKM